MKSLNLFCICFLLFISTRSYANKFVIDFDENSTQKIYGKIISIFTHPTSNYDRNSYTEKAIQQTNKILKDRGVTTILGVDNGATYPYSSLVERYFLLSSDTDYSLETTSGALSLQFPTADLFILAGGNLNFCLCRTLSSLIASQLQYKESIDFYLVADAIYLTSTYSIRDGQNSLRNHISTLHNPSLGRYPSLFDSIGEKTDREIVDYFTSEVFQPGVGFCPFNIEGPSSLNMDLLTINLFRGKEQILTTGNGPFGVHIHIISLNSTKSNLTTLSNLVDGLD